MYFINLNAVVLCAWLAGGAIEVRRGWLDRAVAYHKNRFYNAVLEYAPIQLQATIQRAPPGYTDSHAWNFDSVMHLLVLISESETTIPVKLALRRMLKPTRRLMMSKQKSYKLFPSLSKDAPNNFYYDVKSEEEYEEAEDGVTGVPEDDAVLVVSNPVEARLPSAQISVKLLREILEARAKAGRAMPSTTETPFPWKAMNKTTTNSTSAAESGGGAATTAAGGAGPTTTGSGASPATTTPAA